MNGWYGLYGTAPAVHGVRGIPAVFNPGERGDVLSRTVVLVVCEKEGEASDGSKARKGSALEAAGAAGASCRG